MNEAVSNDEPIMHLSRGYTLSEFLNSGGIQFDINIGEEPIQENKAYKPDEVLNYLNPDALGVTDEDTYDESQPFELLAKKMQNVLENEKIKKRILREGNGLVIPDLSQVTIQYNAYLEYNDEPFDSTYIRKRPFTFRINSGEALPGLDLAVATMKPNEKSQFLIHPDYAYGKFGCPDRIPPNAFVLFEVELKSALNSGATVTYPNLDEEQQKSFEEVYKYAYALCSKGNDYFNKKNFKLAMRDYNMAVSKLEVVEIPSYNEQEKQQKLLLRLYTNLAITYNILNQPRRCCMFCNKVYYLTKGTSLKVPAKVYFHNARALIKLSDFHVAQKRLSIAKSMEPENLEISEEFKVLEEAKKQALEREKILAKAFLNCSFSRVEESQPPVSESFKKVIEDVCNELIANENQQKYKLPPKLNRDEKRCVERISREHGLVYEENDIDDVYIAKKEEEEEF